MVLLPNLSVLVGCLLAALGDDQLLGIVLCDGLVVTLAVAGLVGEDNHAVLGRKVTILLLLDITIDILDDEVLSQLAVAIGGSIGELG